MQRSTRSSVGVLALALCAALLSGCAAPGSVADATPTPRQSSAKPSPSTPTPTSSAPSPPEDLSFEAGAGLADGDWEMGWGDNFADNPGFTVLSPDDGKGSYSYTDAETQCRLFLYQGEVTDLDLAQDDRTISDDFLATVLTGTVEGATREDVAAHAYDDLVGQYPGPGTASTRTIWGKSSDGGSWLHSARMFGALGAGVYVGITCPAGQDASAELAKLVQNHLALLVTPSA